MENAIDIKYNKEALVVQANELIRSRQDDLTLVEAKLIRLAIAQIAECDSDLRTYSCQVTELAQHIGLPKDNLYRDIEIMARGIMKKSIYVRDTKTPPKKSGQYNYEIFNWVDYFRYKDGVITIRISDKLKPLLLGLSEHFTRYGYSNIVCLPSANSIRLLELITSYESLINTHAAAFTPSNPYPTVEKADNELIFTIDFLKEYFNCMNKYDKPTDFINRVIATSVKAINKESTTHKVAYRVAKEGKRLAYVLFKVNAWEDKEFLKFIGVGE